MGTYYSVQPRDCEFNEKELTWPLSVGPFRQTRGVEPSVSIVVSPQEKVTTRCGVTAIGHISISHNSRSTQAGRKYEQHLESSLISAVLFFMGH